MVAGAGLASSLPPVDDREGREQVADSTCVERSTRRQWCIIRWGFQGRRFRQNSHDKVLERHLDQRQERVCPELCVFGVI
jgi:hypothetical protein